MAMRRSLVRGGVAGSLAGLAGCFCPPPVPSLAVGLALAILVLGVERLLSPVPLPPPAHPVQQTARHSRSPLARLQPGVRAVPVLEVVIAPHCLGCARAQVLAAETARRFPGLTVRVVDLATATAPLPPRMVAVPAYVLDGTLIFTGNPTVERLTATLSGLLEQGTGTLRDRPRTGVTPEK